MSDSPLPLSAHYARLYEAYPLRVGSGVRLRMADGSTRDGKVVSLSDPPRKATGGRGIAVEYADGGYGDGWDLNDVACLVGDYVAPVRRPALHGTIRSGRVLYRVRKSTAVDIFAVSIQTGDAPKEIQIRLRGVDGNNTVLSMPVDVAVELGRQFRSLAGDAEYSKVYVGTHLGEEGLFYDSPGPGRIALPVRAEGGPAASAEVK